MPQHSGSASSKSSVVSLVTYAAPVMCGSTPSRCCPSMVNEASNVVPITLSCRQISPGCNFSLAARQASYALMPVPQGERSYARPGHNTKLRLSSIGPDAGPKISM